MSDSRQAVGSPHTASQVYYRPEKLEPVLTDWEKTVAPPDYITFIEETTVCRDIVAASEKRNGDPVRVLDIGCGTGFFWKFLSSRLPPGVHIDCWLLDCSAYSIEQCAETIDKNMGGKCAVKGKVCINAELLNKSQELKNLQFDLIISLHSLYTINLTAMPAFCEAVSSLLATPGGKYWYLNYSKESFSQELNEFHASRMGVLLRMCMAEDLFPLLESYLPGVQVQILSYYHTVHGREGDTELANYLKKMTLDSDFDKEDAVQLISKYGDGDGLYRFPHKAHAIAWQK